MESTSQVSTGTGIVISVVGTAFMVGLYLLFSRAKRRSDRNVAIVTPLIPGQAAVRGWGYLAEDVSRVRYFKSYPFFSNVTMHAHDIVWGTVDGRPFETFGLSFSANTYASAGDGKQFPSAHDFQVVWIPLAGALPLVQFTKDDSALRKLAALGSARVEVESAEFNDIWNAYSRDARVCHAVLNPRLIERLLAPDARVLDYTFEGAALMTSLPYLTDLYEVEDMVRTLHAVVDLVPPFLFGDRSGGQPEGLGEASK